MRRTLFAAALATLCYTAAAHAQAQTDSTIVIGFRTALHSAVLGEERPVHVYLPAGAQPGAPGDVRYPVLYLLDGDAHFHHATGLVQFLAANGRIPEMIVIAVPNTERTRDLTPLARADSAWLTTPAGERQLLRFPGQGGADAFLRFLTEELAPWVDARYPTAPYRVLVGHSFGGLFAVHAAFTRPESFDAYISVSPSLWWDERKIIEEAASTLGARDFGGRFLFMTMGDEGPNMNDNIERFAELLRTNPPTGLRWEYRSLASDNHGTTPHRTLYDGLEVLFEGWDVPEALLFAGDVARVDAHYAQLRSRFGFLAGTPEAVLNQMGYLQLQLGEPARAVEIFRENVKRFPESANVYDSLGDGLMATGDVRAAIAQYEVAVARGEAEGHPWLAEFRRHLEEARRQLSERP